MPSELKKPEPVAEICSASHDDAAFGERSIRALRDIDGLEYGTLLVTAAQLEQYAADRVREAEEAIADEYAMRLQSDLEHGVRSINERYARNFNQSYPLLAGFMGWLNDRTLKEQTK